MAEERVYDIEYNDASAIVEHAVLEYGADHLAVHVEPCEGGYFVQMLREDDKNTAYLKALSSSIPYLDALDRSLKLADQYHLRWEPN
ncbi:hypothetical protein IEO70_08065 [Bacillus sp. AGMB 02131]|uniref:Uncharacterized protein n=1 Tax=Peribacillus faecalis TaxID=2772559 RepID=A0A927CW90_9BACI|nr:hypothetical protein [Peribacillus faecalis]MBD3108319.1 hypothetical protein [Peribacillus faecalis]